MIRERRRPHLLHGRHAVQDLPDAALPQRDEPVGDLNLRELAALAPIMVLFVALGVYPQPVLDASRHDIQVIERIAQGAKNRSLLAATIAEKQHAEKVVDQEKAE